MEDIGNNIAPPDKGALYRIESIHDTISKVKHTQTTEIKPTTSDNS